MVKSSGPNYPETRRKESFLPLPRLPRKKRRGRKQKCNSYQESPNKKRRSSQRDELGKVLAHMKNGSWREPRWGHPPASLKPYLAGLQNPDSSHPNLEGVRRSNCIFLVLPIFDYGVVKMAAVGMSGKREMSALGHGFVSSVKTPGPTGIGELSWRPRKPPKEGASSSLSLCQRGAVPPVSNPGSCGQGGPPSVHLILSWAHPPTLKGSRKLGIKGIWSPYCRPERERICRKD